MVSSFSLISEVVTHHYCCEDYGPAQTPARPRKNELHIHPFYQLDQFLEGGVTVFLEGRPALQSSPFTCLLIPPMTQHGYASVRPALVSTFKFYLHPRYWLQFGEVGGLVPFPRWFGKMVRDVHDLPEYDITMKAQSIEAAITICLTDWLRRQSPSLPPKEPHDEWDSKIRTLLERVAAEPCARWRVDELARSCHVSTDHFCRRFFDIVGKTPQRFLLELRLRTVAARLLYEKIPIKEGAVAAGYTTVHAFTRAFGKVFGKSPAAYVKTIPQR